MTDEEHEKKEKVKVDEGEVGCVIQTGYFDGMLLERNNTVVEALKRLEKHKDEFDVIVCRGYSGMALAPIVAYLLDKPLHFVRKDGENSHSSTLSNGALGRRYLIVDDFICTGNTLHTIMDRIRECHAERVMEEPKFVGLYMYDKRWVTSVEWDGIPCWNKVKLA